MIGDQGTPKRALSAMLPRAVEKALILTSTAAGGEG